MGLRPRGLWRRVMSGHYGAKPRRRTPRPAPGKAPRREEAMTDITRRQGLGLGIGAVAAGLVGRGASAAVTGADVAPPKLELEKGASLRVLRPTKFVDPDEVIFRENTERFAKETGIPVRVDFVGWEDLRPQAAVAANTGAGPDVVVGWTDDPHIYADKLLDMTELAGYLGQKYGGWYPLAER